MGISVFTALGAMQNNDLGFFQRLCAQDRKMLSPYLLLLWVRHPLSQSSIRLLAANEYVNPFVFFLNRHPDLLYRLFCLSQSGYGSSKFLFDRPPAIDLRTKIVADYERCDSNRARDRAVRLPIEQLIQMARELGWSEDKIGMIVP